MFSHVALTVNLWNRSPFLSPNSVHFEMRYESSQVIALPMTRRRMTPPAPVQNSYTFCEREQGSYEGRRQRMECDEKRVSEVFKQVRNGGLHGPKRMQDRSRVTKGRG